MELECARSPLDDSEYECNAGSVVAYVTQVSPLSALWSLMNKEKDLDHPVITFSPIFFNCLPTFDVAIKKANANENSEQKNVLSMRSHGTI